MAADRADLPAAGAAAVSVIAGVAAALRRRLCPPSCIDIIGELAIFQFVPTSLPTRESEKEKEERERKSLLSL